MKKTEKRQVGDLGESVLCRYLEKRGYRVLDRNYLKPWGELDVVAEKGNSIRFFEVKSVRRVLSPNVTREPFGAVSREMIRPEENMHAAKLKRLHRVVQTYLEDRKIPDTRPWQIDLACVYLDIPARRARVEIIENVIL